MQWTELLRHGIRLMLKQCYTHGSLCSLTPRKVVRDNPSQQRSQSQHWDFRLFGLKICKKSLVNISSNQQLKKCCRRMKNKKNSNHHQEDDVKPGEPTTRQLTELLTNIACIDKQLQ
ncbi:hypothetical protein Hamer_G003999 [Homarus americanus]|uniref:Uncharacterized protein n=1 Tax=Homarus americanus TaxID=6706 RepID=A0A8J5TLH4_HOMAM|nr:hypothetical protein Hamer_G003999 [Homarus americanus]